MKPKINNGVIKFEDGEIYYQTAGFEQPVLFLHAGIADSRMWDDQIEKFAPHQRAIIIDLPGYGKSRLPNAAFTYHEAILTLIDFLVQDKIWLVGASFGGSVAVDFSLAYPERVRGLVLAAPLVSGYQPGKQINTFNEQEKKYLDAGDLEGATELNLRLWVDGIYRTRDQVDSNLRDKVKEMQLAAFSTPEPENADVIDLKPAAIKRLHQVRVPTLILIGNLDLPEVVHHANFLTQQIQLSEQLKFPEASHMISMEEPDRFAEAVLRFIYKHKKIETHHKYSGERNEKGH